MIVLDLSCEQDHRFEGWFSSHDDFEKQCANKLIACPVCGQHIIRKLPSAPYVQRSGATTATRPTQFTDPFQLLEKLREQAQQADDVGERFPEEARRIHSGDAEARNIQGVATLNEAKELLEEGIQVIPLPPKKKNLH